MLNKDTDGKALTIGEAQRRAKNELGWVAEYGIEEMCADSWNWQKNNPDGYHTVK